MGKGLVAIACFAAIPIVQLVAQNPGEPLPIGRFIAYWVMAVLVLSVLMRVIGIGDDERTERAAASVAFGTYAVAYLTVPVTEALHVGESELWTGGRIDGVAWVALALIITGVVISRWRLVRQLIPVFAVLILLYAAVGLIGRNSAAALAISTGLDLAEVQPVGTPNVYWFVLDGYGREDVLDAMGASDQASFIRDLETRGFHVEDRAVSAYPMTFLSVSSTLTMDYVAEAGDDISSRLPYYRVIGGQNAVVDTFRSWGYRYILYPAPFWEGSQCRGYEDICLSDMPMSLADAALLSMTAFGPILENSVLGDASAKADRVDPTFVVRRLEQAASEEPFFLFAHLMNPHPPYFRLHPECRPQEVPREADSDRQYLAAVKCLNHQVIEAVDRIMELDETALIIVQADHGPGNGVPAMHAPDLTAWTPEQVKRRLSVFSASRLPDCPEPAGDALVNTFRIVFSCLSDKEIPLLDVRNWIASYYSQEVAEVPRPR